MTKTFGFRTPRFPGISGSHKLPELTVIAAAIHSMITCLVMEISYPNKCRLDRIYNSSHLLHGVE